MKECDTGNIVNIEERGLKYRVRVLIKHPSQDLAALMRGSSLAPKLLFTKGAQRFAPNGTALPGTHATSVWSYWEDFRDSRAVSKGIRSTLDAMAPARDSINDLRNSGGQAMLILELEGDRNIGDVVDRRELARMAELGLDLGVEVYPGGFKP